MAGGIPIETIVRELRSLAAARRRRVARAGDAVELLAQLVAACRAIAVEDRPNGIAFRLAPADADAIRLTCILHQPQDPPLTRTEDAVAQQLCEGRTLAQIAHLRGVSVNTIKSQVRQVFRKLNVDSRVALVRRLCL